MKSLAQVGKTAPILQINSEEKELLKKIKACSPDSIETTLAENLENLSFESYVRLSIYDQRIHQWCIKNLTGVLETKLEDLSESFEYKFIPQKNLSLFDMAAGATMILSAIQMSKLQELAILYVALEKFHSMHAALTLIPIGIELLAKERKATFKEEEKEKKLVKSLEHLTNELVIVHGAPACLLFCIMIQKMGEHFRKKDKMDQANAAFFLAFQYLLGAAKLADKCDAEFSNSSYGMKSLFIQQIHQTFNIKTDSDEISFRALIDSYKASYSKYISSLEDVADQRAKELASRWAKYNP